MRTLAIALVLSMVTMVSTAGCAGRSAASRLEPASRAAPRPALINHCVLFKLQNPEDAAELIADCDRDLGSIPGVVSYFAGRHFEMGRANIDASYDAAFYVGFDSKEDYQRYVDHPRHVASVAKWKPRWESIRIFDVIDSTP